MAVVSDTSVYTEARLLVANRSQATVNPGADAPGFLAAFSVCASGQTPLCLLGGGHPLLGVNRIGFGGRSKRLKIFAHRPNPGVLVFCIFA